MTDAKLRRPLDRGSGLVQRDAAIAELDKAVPAATVLAPAGYGKTTLLTQWAERQARPVAWLTVDELDDDPIALLAALLAAISSVGPVDPRFERQLAARQRSEAMVSIARLADALEAVGPMVLLIDDVHHLGSTTCQRAVAHLLERLTPDVRVVLAGRHWSSASLARVRSMGSLVEIGPRELAMSDDEAAILFDALGVDRSTVDVVEVNARTEGWAAALYLRAVAERRRHDEQPQATSRAGDDGSISDYIWAEFLSEVSDEDVRFLERTSVLEHLSGDRCDAVLGTTGSGATLARLRRENLLVTEHSDDAYRYHSLMRDALLRRLEEEGPEEANAVRRAAAGWAIEHGAFAEAGVYAIAVGDEQLVASLIAQAGQQMYATNRATTLDAWIEWLDEHGRIERYPGAAALVGLYRALTGRPADAERWADAAALADPASPAPDGTSPVDGVRALLRALMCRDGVDAMRRDAQQAVELLGPSSPLRPAALVFLGVAHVLAGDADAAEAAFDDAAELGSAIAPPAAAAGYAERALLAVHRGEWAAAEELAHRSATVMHVSGIEEHSTSALQAAIAARIAIHRGDAATARAEIVRANRLRPTLTKAIPHIAVQVRLELAQASVALGDHAAARLMLREIAEILARRPDLGILIRETEAMQARLQGIGTGSGSTPSLTTAELRLLPYLPTHLSFREIGAELFLSPNTVKTQAISIYRKLGVVSRSEAIARATELGLLEG